MPGRVRAPWHHPSQLPFRRLDPSWLKLVGDHGSQVRICTEFTPDVLHIGQGAIPCCCGGFGLAGRRQLSLRIWLSNFKVGAGSPKRRQQHPESAVPRHSRTMQQRW